VTEASQHFSDAYNDMAELAKRQRLEVAGLRELADVQRAAIRALRDELKRRIDRASPLNRAICVAAGASGGLLISAAIAWLIADRIWPAIIDAGVAAIMLSLAWRRS
jgi:hypothetical protein